MAWQGLHVQAPQIPVHPAAAQISPRSRPHISPQSRPDIRPDLAPISPPPSPPRRCIRGTSQGELDAPEAPQRPHDGVDYRCPERMDYFWTWRVLRTLDPRDRPICPPTCALIRHLFPCARRRFNVLTMGLPDVDPKHDIVDPDEVQKLEDDPERNKACLIAARACLQKMQEAAYGYVRQDAAQAGWSLKEDEQGKLVDIGLYFHCCARPPSAHCSVARLTRAHVSGRPVLLGELAPPAHRRPERRGAVLRRTALQEPGHGHGA